jgi:beta-lactamase class A
MASTSRFTRFTATALVLVSLVSATPAQAAPADDLSAQISTYLATQEGDYTVSIRELGPGGISTGIVEDGWIEPASVVKLFYAWAALRRVDLGSINLNQTMANGLTWDRCLRLMISISDNECSADIRVALGNRTLNTLFAAAGYPNTFIKLTTRGAYDGKRTSAADTALLLTRLEEGTLLSPESTQYFHQLLKDQVWRTRINLGVPAGTRVENKSGELWVASGWTQSDAAIVRGPHSTYVLVVYGRHDATKAAIAGVSRIAYEFLQGETVTTPATFSAYQFRTTSSTPVRATKGGRVLYRIPSGALVKAYYTERNWVLVRQSGRAKGWITYPHLTLRSEYRWQ